MRATHWQTRRCSQVRFGLLVISVLLGLAGCAQLPSLASLLEAKGSTHYRTASAFAAPPVAWPADRWWEAYDDEQLNDLVDKALRDSPDMVIAAARLRRAEATAQIAGGTRLPQLSANGSATMEKMSYNCVFHAIWTVIPRQSGHAFHVKLDSRSVATRG